jgi:catechol 2,3-dioxygenase-like lactoylglutathione lyase family enzyme
VASVKRFSVESTRERREDRAMSIIDHTSVFVSDYARAKKFYVAALAPLGIELVKEFGQWGGFGRGKKPDFWIGVGPTSYQSPEQARAIQPNHVAFVARSRLEVDAFHRAAIEAGGKDFGKPGLREIYHPNYYGAFVLDPDGHNVEAVFHG